jgi:hypothetical protein
MARRPELRLASSKVNTKAQPEHAHFKVSLAGAMPRYFAMEAAELDEPGHGRANWPETPAECPVPRRTASL